MNERDRIKIERNRIYDEMCSLLTRYESKDELDEEDHVNEYELYDMLVEIASNWEDIITVQY